MVRKPIVLAMLTGLAACSSSARPKGPHRMDPKEIVERSKPAIVRIEDGEGRVGTGFAIDPSGMIATNLHVVVGAKDIRVTTLDGSKLPVMSVVAIDEDHDLAIIDVDPPKPMATLSLGDSDKVSAGDPVVAIGNPLGVFDYTVSDGLIAAVRDVAPDLKLLQISAPISQGSSGGPLFNPFGEVIGVAVLVSTEGQNINFAVPSNYVRTLRAKPQPMTLERFAELTRPRDATPRPPKIVRQIPEHPVAIFKDCQDDDIRAAIEAIDEAIKLGAPLYNEGNFEACFRIYEGASSRLERESSCQGIREAFGAGLLRSTTMASYAEKAWALRDAFDGLIDVTGRYARSRAGGGTP